MVLPNKTKVKRVDNVKNQTEMGYEEIISEFFIDEPAGVNIQLESNVHFKAHNNFIYLNSDPKFGRNTKYSLELKKGTGFFNKHNPSGVFTKDTTVVIMPETEITLTKGSEIYLPIGNNGTFIPIILGEKITAKIC